MDEKADQHANVAFLLSSDDVFSSAQLFLGFDENVLSS